jgi:hypothetical protein
VMALRAQINFAISSAMNGLTPVVACGTWIQHGIIERSRIVCVTNY